MSIPEKIIKMFTRNELIELFRGVVYYTNDPSTFRNIALTCRDFAKICHEYNPMKKNEFRVEKDMELYNEEKWKGWFLPNGHRHEIIFIKSPDGKYGVDMYCVCNNGYMYIYRDDYNLFGLGGYSMIYKGAYYIIDRSKKRLLVEKVSKKYRAIARFKVCELCCKHHNFELDISGYSNRIFFTFDFDCLNNKIYSHLSHFNYSMYEVYLQKIKKLQKRNRIIKSVIAYAKLLKNDLKMDRERE